MNVDKNPERVLHIANQNYLYFGGTAYLGLQGNKEFQDIVCDNIQKWGTSYGSSRLANIALDAYHNCEVFLAKFINAQATVTVSSGMLAGKTVVSELQKTNDVYYHFSCNHEALKTEKSIPFFEGNKLNSRLLDNKKENIIILSDAVLSGEVHGFDPKIFDGISVSKKITLVLDESHSLGILSKNGCGLFAEINHPKIIRKITIASLGKALGVTGGVIASDFEFIENIKNNEIFGSSAGMNPAFAAALSQSEHLIKMQHQKLLVNLAKVKMLLRSNKNVIFDENYPLIYPNIDTIYKKFLNQNIIITHFAYPNAAKFLNRIVVTADHTFDDLEKMCFLLNQENTIACP